MKKVVTDSLLCGWRRIWARPRRPIRTVSRTVPAFVTTAFALPSPNGLRGALVKTTPPAHRGIEGDGGRRAGVARRGRFPPPEFFFLWGGDPPLVGGAVRAPKT